MHFTEEQKQRANRVDLVDFLVRQGEKLIPSGQDKRLQSNHSITVRGNEWYDHAVESGGYPIGFVQKFYELTYPEAVTMLLGGEQGVSYDSTEKKKQEDQKAFSLPAPHTDMRRVYAYLVKSRLIAHEVVSHFVKQKLLYESCEKSRDGRKEYHNAVFVGLDEHGVARHAHKRGLYTMGGGFKGNVDGCNPAYSFHHVGTSNRLYVFEAPVDMLSFITLYPKGWQQHSYVSLCGISEHAMIKMLELYPHLDQVYLCLDHDPAGIEASEKYYDMLTERGIQCGCVLPEHKDWNESIKAAKGLPVIPAKPHPQRILLDQLCVELMEEVADYKAYDDAFQELFALITRCQRHLRSGCLVGVEGCLKDLLAGAMMAAAEEYRQIGCSQEPLAMQAKLKHSFRTYENRGRLESRLVQMQSEINALGHFEGVLTTMEKEQRALCYENIAAHSLKAILLLEQQQQKQEQSQEHDQVLAMA